MPTTSCCDLSMLQSFSTMNTTWLAAFQTFVREHHLCDPDIPVLVAMSGGADSVLLAYLFKSSGYKVRWAHMNYQLRGDESHRDEAFVRDLAQRWNQPLEVRRVDTYSYAAAQHIGIQEAARDLRYAWFDELCLKDTSERIATAHHLSDQVETLLFHLFKGTGIRGLHGIPLRQGRIIRPLMFLFKPDILKAVKELELTYVEDSSNASSTYSRNFLRLEILPKIREHFPQVDQILLSNMVRFQEAEELYDQAVRAQLSQLVQPRGQEQWVPWRKLLELSPVKTLCYEWLKPSGFHPAQIDQVLDLARYSDTGHQVCSATHRLIKDRAWLILAPLHSPEPSSIPVSLSDSQVDTPEFSLELREVGVEAFRTTHKSVETFMDADLLQFPLLLRRWRTGDYFYPLGMRHQKKLSRFFIDQKLSRLDKERVWILQDAGERVVWICGMRLDDRFKVTEKSRRLLHLSMQLRQR